LKNFHGVFFFFLFFSFFHKERKNKNTSLCIHKNIGEKSLCSKRVSSLQVDRERKEQRVREVKKMKFSDVISQSNCLIDLFIWIIYFAKKN